MRADTLTKLNQSALEIATVALANQTNDIRLANGNDQGKVLDFGVKRRGTIAAGLRLAEICLSGLGKVSISQSTLPGLSLPMIQVSVDHPLLACMASQYAGWPLMHGDKFVGMCSGPARALRGKEKVLEQYEMIHEANSAVGVIEANELPPVEAVKDFAEQCNVDVANVVLCVARTASLPGTIQVVARSVETAIHKLHELEFDLSTIKSGFGSAPLPPIGKDDSRALGWTNDSILYGSCVILFVETTDEAIEKIIDRIPSSSSSEFGKPFLEIFKQYDYDFYKIDHMLFSPAQVVINNMSTGSMFEAGEVRTDILKTSFGMG